MTQTKALRLALEALEREEYRLRQTGQSQVYSGIGFAITTIKAALLSRSDGEAHWNEMRASYGARQAALEAKDEPVANYGYCPVCGAKGTSRERHPDGNTTCVNGHKYKSRDTLSAPPQQEAKDEPVAWVPYLSDRADGVQGHYAIARWNPRGYREVWNLRRHTWGAFSDDVMSLEEADYLLQQITIPTRKPTPPAQPVIDESTAKRIATTLGWEPKRKPLTDEQIEHIRQQPQHHKGEFDYTFDEVSFARAIEAAHGIKGEA